MNFFFVELLTNNIFFDFLQLKSQFFFLSFQSHGKLIPVSSRTVGNCTPLDYCMDNPPTPGILKGLNRFSSMSVNSKESSESSIKEIKRQNVIQSRFTKSVGMLGKTLYNAKKKENESTGEKQAGMQTRLNYKHTVPDKKANARLEGLTMESLHDEINKAAQVKEKPSKEQIEKAKQQKLKKTLRNFCMKFHPTNFLLKGLHKDPVCKLCLGNGNVIKCAGKCFDYFHIECLSKSFTELDYNTILKRKMTENVEASNEITSVIVEKSDGLQCTICTTSTSDACFVCSKSDGANMV